MALVTQTITETLPLTNYRQIINTSAFIRCCPSRTCTQCTNDSSVCRQKRRRPQNNCGFSSCYCPSSLTSFGLAADHGGAGRAIQVAVEHLHEYGRRRPRKIEIPDDKKLPFSFAVFPRTRELIKSLSVHYQTSSNVVRACIPVLEDLARIFHPDIEEPREAGGW
jgi:hypothetical protein